LQRSHVIYDSNPGAIRGRGVTIRRTQLATSVLYYHSNNRVASLLFSYYLVREGGVEDLGFRLLDLLSKLLRWNSLQRGGWRGVAIPRNEQGYL